MEDVQRRTAATQWTNNHNIYCEVRTETAVGQWEPGGRASTLTAIKGLYRILLSGRLSSNPFLATCRDYAATTPKLQYLFRDANYEETTYMSWQFLDDGIRVTVTYYPTISKVLPWIMYRINITNTLPATTVHWRGNHLSWWLKCIWSALVYSAKRHGVA